MATSLSALINSRLAKSFPPNETNLEDGQIFVFCSGRVFGCFTNCFAWYAPAAGTAKIEIWGAGGSTGCQCCCNYSIGGQSGAYVKKEVTMTSGGYVCGNTGHPCMPNAGFCYPGCSEATCASICLGTADTCSCLCAQGGNGGLTACTTSTSSMCCLTNCCFSAVVQPSGMGTGCGYVCGCRNTYHVATAYGGDINCPGTYSCVGQWHCDTRGNRPYMNNSLAKPHGQMVSEIATAMVSEDQGTTMGNMQSGHGPSNHQKGQGSINRSSGAGMNSVGACWNSQSHCACYETWACVPFVPPAHGASHTQGCPDVRSVGSRGGLGYVRILFKAT
jgi:hypothetical protein